MERLRERIVGAMTSPAMGALNKTLMLGLMLVAISLVAVLMAIVLRLAVPRSQVTVSAFQVLDLGKDSGTASGKALADLLVDDLQRMMEQTNGTGGNSYSSRKFWRPMSSLPKIPVATSYGIEIKGVSLDQIIATWDRLRYKEYLVGGDLIPGTNGKSVLVVRYSTGGAAKSYERQLKDLEPSTVNKAVSDLSLDLLKGINPAGAARYLTGLEQTCVSDCNAARNNAIQFCYEWLKDKPGDAAALSDVGNALNLSGYYEDSLDYFDRAVAEDHHMSSALLDKGNALDSLGRFDEAEKAYNAALRLRRYPDPILNLGAVAMHRGQYDRAVNFYNQALKIDSGDVGALLDLGHAYIKVGNYPYAAKTFGRALELEPGSDAAVYGIAHSYPKVGKTDEALREIDLYATLNSESAYLVAYKAEALMLAGRLEDAEAESQASLKMLNNLTAQEDVAILHIYRGELSDAATELDGWIVQVPKESRLHILKADVLERQGDNAGAETERQLADRLSPGERYDALRWNQ
jgi:tetratricopeptide (TPR) repeat protein